MVVSEIGCNKIKGPVGNKFLFFNRFWDLLKKEVYVMFKQFYECSFIEEVEIFL